MPLLRTNRMQNRISQALADRLMRPEDISLSPTGCARPVGDQRDQAACGGVGSKPPPWKGSTNVAQ